MTRRILLLAALTLLGLIRPAFAQDAVTVFAAASMKNAIDDINAMFTQRTGLRVNASYASSAALARQIEQGAPADIFISADLAWMDYLAEKKLLRPKARVDLAGNRLVLIAPKDSKLDQADIKPGFDLAALAGDGRIATGDVRAVPAGKYAKAALEKLGVWAGAEPKLAMTENVRAALALVARGEAPLGIVYETDAKVEPGVKIVGTFPANAHPPIVYPAAITASAGANAKRYYDFLLSGTGQVIFERYGFTYLVKPGP